MKGILAICGALLVSATTGCQTGQTSAVAGHERSPLISQAAPAFTPAGAMQMGSGDALGQQMFVDDALARGPVLVDTATADISGD